MERLRIERACGGPAGRGLPVEGYWLAAAALEEFQVELKARVGFHAG